MAIVLDNAILAQLDPVVARQGRLRVEEGRITHIGVVPEDASDSVIDCEGAVVLPGFVNGHTHLYSALAAGMPAPHRTPKSFHEILRFVWWRLDRAHDEESIEASGSVGAQAALRCGTTTLIDHHASPNAIEGSLDALQHGIDQIGCRGVLCYEVTDRNGLGGAEQGVAENRRYVVQCDREKTHRFAGLVGGHASFTLGQQSLEACADLCRELNVGFHVHVAEDPVDERLTRDRFGSGLVDRLSTAGLLKLPHTIFAHGTHLSESDIRRLNDCPEVVMAHNPASNMNNGVGYTPVAAFERPPMLGTDGIGSDLWQEARLALIKSHDAELAIGFDRPLRMMAESARFASQCLGVKLGVLQEGAAADLVITDYVPATPLRDDNLAAHVLFALGSERVRHVMVDGVWRLFDRHLTDVDEHAIRVKAAETAERLYQRMAAIPCE